MPHPRPVIERLSQGHANLTTLPSNFFFRGTKKTEVRAYVCIRQKRIHLMAILSTIVRGLDDRGVIVQRLP